MGVADDFICENCGYSGPAIGIEDCPNCGARMLPLGELGKDVDMDLEGFGDDDGGPKPGSPESLEDLRDDEFADDDEESEDL